MVNDRNDSQLNCQKADGISFSKKHFKSSLDVINAVIKELREAQIDINKVAFFEDPLEAIVHINKAEEHKAGFLWLKILPISKRHNSIMQLKLSVFQKTNPHIPYLLKYEILPNSI